MDRIALGRWLERTIGADPDVVVSRFGQATGVGNALFDVTAGSRRLVLRRPPLTKVTPSAGNTVREAGLLAALADTGILHPRLVAVCEDVTVIGAPFLLMERVDGYTPVDPLPDTVRSDPRAMATLGNELIDALAALAQADWVGIGLTGFGKPDGFLARQVDRWLWQLDSYRTRDLPGIDRLTGWLRSNLPAPGPTGIVHGDYSMFNVMYRNDEPTRLAAIVDWDTATIGEPLMDLGHVLARWDEPGETRTRLGSADIADRTGLPSRRSLAERYASRTGFDLSHIRYYQVLSLFKLACIMEGHYSQQVASGDAHAVTGTAASERADAAPEMLEDAWRIAMGDRT